MCIVSEQLRVNVSLHEDDLRRLDDWAAERGITRSRAVVALLDLVTGVSESREQKLARARGLLARPVVTHVPGGPRSYPKPVDPPTVGRVVDDSEDYKQ